MVRLTAVALTLLTTMSLAAAPQIVPVFPDLDVKLKDVERTDHRGNADAPNDFTRDVAYPTLEVHLPEGASSPTPAIIVCPGGAYVGVAMDKEGRATAKFLSSHGVAALVLKYRMPKPEVTKDEEPLPLQDARQALRLAHEHAKDWNIDPEKVGVMGFSAGGHLASSLITHPGGAADPKPNFGVLVYPVITFKDPVAHKGSRRQLLGATPDPKLLEFYSNETQVTEQTPPTFLVHAADDQVSCQNSILFFDALRAHKVPAELHLFGSGGHGFGVGAPGTPAAQWPELLLTWMRAQKLLAP